MDKGYPAPDANPSLFGLLSNDLGIQGGMDKAKDWWDGMNTMQKVGMSPVGYPVTDAIGLLGDVQMYRDDPESRGLLNYGMSAAGLLPFVPAAGSISKEGKQYIEDVLSGAVRPDRKKIVGELSEEQLSFSNALRGQKGWEPREAGLLNMTPGDFNHMRKRIDTDGMTPAEVAELAAYAFDDASTPIKSGARMMLEYRPGAMIDGQHYTPQGLLIDGDEWTSQRLYGVIPRGWDGRNK